MKKLLLILLLAPIMVNSQDKKKVPRMVPDHVKLQYAGTIGLVSIGVGYESPNNKFQGDFFYGYVPPKYGGGKTIHSITGKFTWLPLATKLDEQTRIDILTAGILFNYAFGSQFFSFKPNFYPYQYYGFPTALNGNIFIGTGITRGRVGLYYELGVNGKDALSYVKNTNSLSFFDILNMGVGAKLALK